MNSTVISAVIMVYVSVMLSYAVFKRIWISTSLQSRYDVFVKTLLQDQKCILLSIWTIMFNQPSILLS